MIHGTLIGDSLRIGAELHPEGWSVTRIYRLDVSGDPAEEDNAWTVIDFHADDDDVADALGQAFASSLEAVGGWYADFRVGEDHVVVFAGKQLRYSRWDADGRAEAVATADRWVFQSTSSTGSTERNALPSLFWRTRAVVRGQQRGFHRRIRRGQERLSNGSVIQ